MGAWLCFEDEAGQGLRPPKDRTRGRRGHTPVVRTTAASTKRISMAALICTKAGHRPRLIYRIHLHRGPAKGRPKASRRPTMPACWIPRTNSSATPSWWCGTT